MGLPIRLGSPISICFKPDLTVSRGKLLSGRVSAGRAVHAASYIRDRRIVLETQLLERSDALRLILVHELCHYVWPKLGNALRAEFESLLLIERQARARGEAGESAQVAKSHLQDLDSQQRSPAWREYACESFCDTAALLYSGVSVWEFCTLASRWRKRREQWFDTAIHWDGRWF
jgi:hypothetical protein